MRLKQHGVLFFLLIGVFIFPNKGLTANSLGGELATSSFVGNMMYVSAQTGCIESGASSDFKTMWFFNDENLHITGAGVSGGNLNSNTNCRNNETGYFDDLSRNWMIPVSANASSTGYYHMYYCSPKASCMTGGTVPLDIPSGIIWDVGFYWNGFSAIPLAEEHSTRIDAVTPYNNQTVSSTSAISLFASGYINPNDAVETLGEESPVQIKWNLYSESQDLLGNCIDVICAFNDVHKGKDFYSGFSASDWGSQYFSLSSSTVTALPIGWYRMTTSIVEPKTYFGFSSLFGFSFGEKVLVSTTTSFKVDEASSLDMLMNTIQGSTPGSNPSAYGGLFGSSSTTEEILNLSDCKMFNFSVSGCLSVLFLPNFLQLLPVWESAKTGFLAVIPWGYVTQILSDLNRTATSTLPLFEISTPPNFPFNGTLSLDIFGSLPTASTSIFALATSSTGATFRETVEPFWNTIWAVLFGILLLQLILGVELIGQNNFGSRGSLSDQGKNDDSYRLKEYLYKHRKK